MESRENSEALCPKIENFFDKICEFEREEVQTYESP